jgi:hypothetical protein
VLPIVRAFLKSAASFFATRRRLRKREVIGGLAAYELQKFEQGRNEIYIYDRAIHREPVQFDHETNELQAVGMNFWQLLEREMSALRARKDRKGSGI